MKRIIFIGSMLLIPVGLALAADEPETNAAPQWFVEEIATLTQGSGRWITDNSAYQSDQEPYEAYGTEWKSSFGGTVMKGRLFGIKDGQEVGDFWEFVYYWHPERKEAVAEQFGWGGAIGIGKMWTEDGETKTDQRYFSADGSQSRTGHVSSFPDADTHVTESFEIKLEKWNPQRKYTWRRALP